MFNRFILVLTTILLAQIALNAGFWLIGRENLPLMAVGLTQLLPGLIVLLMTGTYRRRLWTLIRRIPPLRPLAGWWLWTALVICACGAAVLFFGVETAPVDAATIATYPFAWLLPDAASATPVAFLVFLLLCGPLLHLVTAAGEEVLWRGYLLDGLTERYGVRAAVIGSAFAWGAWHIPMVIAIAWVFPQPLLGSVLFTLSLTSWGIVLACLRLRHESLWTPVLMHAVANAFTLGAYDLIADPHSNWLTSPWGVTGMVLTVPVALWLLSRLKPGNRQAPNRHSS